MAHHSFSLQQWSATCEAIALQCERRAMTALHYTFLFGQEVEDALEHVPSHAREHALRVAESLGYENRAGRESLAGWVTAGTQQRSAHV